jgi:hypothetical protein
MAAFSLLLFVFFVNNQVSMQSLRLAGEKDTFVSANIV